MEKGADDSDSGVPASHVPRGGVLELGTWPDAEAPHQTA